MNDYTEMLEQRVIELEEALEKDKHLFRVLLHGECYKLISPLEVYEDSICSFNRRLVGELFSCGYVKKVSFGETNWKRCTCRPLDKVFGDEQIVKYTLPVGVVLKIFNFDFKKIKTEYSYVQTIIRCFPGHPEFINYKFRMPKNIYSVLEAESCSDPIDTETKVVKIE